ncbi:hypothetical protein CAPTEDRAFT_210656, partial [Capitella teleta]
VDECKRELYDVGCHTCVNLIGGHTCLCNDTFILDKNRNNETCVDPSQQSSARSSTGIIIGAVVAILFLIAAVVAVVCLIKKRRRDEKKACVSSKVPDADKMETNEYEELRGSFDLRCATRIKITAFNYLHRRISVLTLDHELTNKAIISLRQNLIPNGRSPKCAIMCKDGQQLSGFFIGVNCMLDMVDKGNKMNSMHGLNKFKTVCPEFEPSEEQLLQLSQLSKDYISHGKKSK